jgi:hypothetical protein
MDTVALLLAAVLGIWGLAILSIDQLRIHIRRTKKR